MHQMPPDPSLHGDWGQTVTHREYNTFPIKSADYIIRNIQTTYGLYQEHMNILVVQLFSFFCTCVDKCSLGGNTLFMMDNMTQYDRTGFINSNKTGP